ncbi:hypothetical protein KP78_04590 [Jeotgalibacillus soli]|uniref:Uncharacterized protein n=1 Tax=Jeotgalibacillus soli TaxID=889306 RepID=A0A0C2SDR3_9BACL|nr:hypothetical protein KP78_04590 [Jeotgalibacillus soli]
MIQIVLPAAILKGEAGNHYLSRLSRWKCFFTVFGVMSVIFQSGATSFLPYPDVIIDVTAITKLIRS